MINTIKATSRASVKIRDSFYTFEYSEEHTVPEDVNITEARNLLWDTVNNEVDKQIEDVLEIYGRK